MRSGENLKLAQASIVDTPGNGATRVKYSAQRKEKGAMKKQFALNLSFSSFYPAALGQIFVRILCRLWQTELCTRLLNTKSLFRSLNKMNGTKNVALVAAADKLSPVIKNTSTYVCTPYLTLRLPDLDSYIIGIFLSRRDVFLPWISFDFLFKKKRFTKHDGMTHRHQHPNSWVTRQPNKKILKAIDEVT